VYLYIKRPNQLPYKMAKPGEKEVFRITPVIGKCYEWAESTRTSGRYPNEKRFAPEQNVIYVGELINISEGGFSDGSWRTDTFINHETGARKKVPYSYEGKTCFIEKCPLEIKTTTRSIWCCWV
jgi:hypothetical protein